jgi:urease accessory protein
MHVIDTYEGNVSERGNTPRPEECETVVVDETDRRRSRFRTTTEAGTEVGVVVGRELRAGDVLSGDGLAVAVELEPVEALSVDLADLASRAAVELGHAAGNRHWKMAVRDGTVLFPVADSVDRMAAAVELHLPDGATVGTESVPPSVFDGGHHEPGHGHDHSHDHAGDHTHPHGDRHDHSHDHPADGDLGHPGDGGHDHDGGGGA